MILFNRHNIINTIFIIPIDQILEAGVVSGMLSVEPEKDLYRTVSVLQYLICEWLRDIRRISIDNYMPGFSTDSANYVYEVSAIAYAIFDKYIPTIPIELHGRHRRCNVIVIGNSAHILLRSTNELN